MQEARPFDELTIRAERVISHSHALAPATRLALARSRANREAAALSRQARGTLVRPAQPSDPVAQDAQLTPRQLEILRLIDAGLGTKQIARELWLSPATVRNHAAGIMASLGVHSRLQALAKARQLGLL